MFVGADEYPWCISCNLKEKGAMLENFRDFPAAKIPCICGRYN